ncbi:hypothetical protein Poly24_48520 [Rosistilla carotiformis]|uniref:Uncharacterized protein n=1 Tax=Rosistilla carotiformis TaxID=2528017 RepID=A0A518JZZ1_9BACT|nr:hypothetical protein Poly24_48520 [Rosistilla carotiformis]
MFADGVKSPAGRGGRGAYSEMMSAPICESSLVVPAALSRPIPSQGVSTGDAYIASLFTIASFKSSFSRVGSLVVTFATKPRL